MVESLQQCVVAIDGSATAEGSGGIEQAMKAVAQERLQFLSMHGGRFYCMKALETKLLVSRVDAVRVLEMFGGINQFPHAQQVAQILSHGVPVRVNGVGDLKAALQYSNHSSIDQYTEHFVTNVVKHVRLGRAFIFLREMASRIPGLRVSPVSCGILGDKGADCTRFNYGIFEPGRKQGYQF